MPVKSKFLSFARSGQPRQPQPSSKILGLILIILIAAAGVFVYANRLSPQNRESSRSKFGEMLKGPRQTATPTPTPTPTPRPLTFAEMNALYGPCVWLPTLMYHHIQSQDAAKANKQTGLTVYTDVFKNQMQYLKDKNYNTVSMNDLVNFFDNGAAVPARSVLLTFDDGYGDFYTDAFPILQSLGFRATMFTPTGLINNPGYLSWDQISQMSGQILFANHTWSHKSVVTETSVMQREISTADIQLSEHGLGNPKIFAYPYGPDSVSAENYLKSLEYKAAFTTVPGSTLCKKQRLSLPRLRIGNAPLSGYGF